MATLKTTYIQHPDSLIPQIELSASGMSFSASALQLFGGELDLPEGTTIDGDVIVTENSIPAPPPSQYKAFGLFLGGM
jgi:hypothetical protein